MGAKETKPWYHPSKSQEPLWWLPYCRGNIYLNALHKASIKCTIHLGFSLSQVSPPLGSGTSVALSQRERCASSLARQRIWSCPRVLEIRELSQHRPFTTVFRDALDSRLKVHKVPAKIILLPLPETFREITNVQYNVNAGLHRVADTERGAGRADETERASQWRGDCSSHRSPQSHSGTKTHTELNQTYSVVWIYIFEEVQTISSFKFGLLKRVHISYSCGVKKPPGIHFVVFCRVGRWEPRFWFQELRCKN